MEPFTLIVFGITSNLAKLKLIPALYDLEEKHVLSEGTRIIGIARGDYGKSQFTDYIKGILVSENRHHKHPTEVSVIKRLIDKMEYLKGDIEDMEGVNSPYLKLKDKFEADGYPDNFLYYLATYPDLYGTIFRSLQKYDMGKIKKGWVRLMIEKPIGTDYSSARKLDVLLHKFFREEQIYRLDHYLGKETIQNILVFRFGNGILQPLMNNKYVDHIQITAAEDFGIGPRGGYFDTMGTLKDVGQNHLLQMLAVATMRAPKKFNNDDVTAERIRIIKNLKAYPEKIVFGQYNGYLYEDNVAKKSSADTFFALKTSINTGEWKGVPVYMRAGKKLAQFVTEISIVFKVPAMRMFPDIELGKRPNVLTYRVQPNEGIGLELLSKVPGHDFKLESDYMQFCYKSLKNNHYDAYEKLIYDAMTGDPTFFNDSPEVEASWKFVDKYTWAKNKVHIYEQGSWGPEEARKIIEDDGRSWIEPSPMLCNIF